MFGSQFTPQTMLSLRKDSGEIITAQSVQFVNENHLVAKFDLTGLPTGNYRVQADDAGRTAVAFDTFTVTSAPPGKAQVNIWTPAVIVNLGRKPTLHIDVLNTGDNRCAGPIHRRSRRPTLSGSRNEIVLMGGSEQLPSLLPPDFFHSVQNPLRPRTDRERRDEHVHAPRERSLRSDRLGQQESKPSPARYTGRRLGRHLDEPSAGTGRHVGRPVRAPAKRCGPARSAGR